MKPENRKILDDNRHHWETFKRAEYIQHLDGKTREDLLRVIREEFNPAYLATLWCQSCVVDMLKFAYTQYDKVLAQEATDAATAERPLNPPTIAEEPPATNLAGSVQRETFPAHTPAPKKRGRRKRNGN